MYRRVSKSSFSLIEMMVVLAVLAIVISMLTPALQKTLRMARMGICVKQMQQMGVGVMLYAEDNVDTLPMGEPSRFHWLWAKLKVPLERALLPYMFTNYSEADVRNPADAIYVCPASPVEY